jgi:hypothetical protein
MNAGCQKANERENPRFRDGVCRPKSKSFSKIRQDRGVLGQRLPVVEYQRWHSALRIDLQVGLGALLCISGSARLRDYQWRDVSCLSTENILVEVLARLFRGKMLAMLMEAHDANQLTFFNTHVGLADKSTFKRFIAPLRRIKWVVYCKAPFAGPEQVLRYLSRYTHRVAISNRLERGEMTALKAIDAQLRGVHPARDTA